MARLISTALPIFAGLLASSLPASAQDVKPPTQEVAAPAPDVPALLQAAVANLIAIQEEDGAWPYEGVYRVRREIPVGYRIGGTAIVCEALMYGAPPEDERASAAINRGVALILTELEHPLMAPSVEDAYDVRVWGHIYALDLFCQLRATKRMGAHAEQIEAWIPRLIEVLVTEQISDGGWNYANQRSHASFVTPPAVQALLWARSQGYEVADDVLARARAVLEKSRLETGAYFYSGSSGRPERAPLPGSVARSAGCEATLTLLGGSSQEAILHAINAFHEHWDELEKRRKKTGTHEPPYSVAPYYFYYGHRYAAQAIQMLPEEERPKEHAKLVQVLLRTRDEDGTWNDRVFERSRNYGTAMAVMLLLGDRAPLPPGIEISESEGTSD